MYHVSVAIPTVHYLEKNTRNAKKITTTHQKSTLRIKKQKKPAPHVRKRTSIKNHTPHDEPVLLQDFMFHHLPATGKMLGDTFDKKTQIQ